MSFRRAFTRGPPGRRRRGALTRPARPGSPRLGADEGGDLVGVAVDRVEGAAGQEPDHQAGGEGVAGADGVARPRRAAPGGRTIGRRPGAGCRRPRASGPPATARTGAPVPSIASRTPAGSPNIAASSGNSWSFSLRTLASLQRVGDHVAVDERGPEVHVEDPNAPGRAAETSARIARRAARSSGRGCRSRRRRPRGRPGRRSSAAIRSQATCSWMVNRG